MHSCLPLQIPCLGVIWEQCAGGCVPCSWAFCVEEQVCGDGFALACLNYL